MPNVACPPDYETKFADLLVLCREADRDHSRGRTLVVRDPSTLGDTYEELIESLKRISRSGLLLAICDR